MQPHRKAHSQQGQDIVDVADNTGTIEPIGSAVLLMRLMVLEGCLAVGLGVVPHVAAAVFVNCSLRPVTNNQCFLNFFLLSYCFAYRVRFATLFRLLAATLLATCCAL
jgi:hypothetical protein